MTGVLLPLLIAVTGRWEAALVAGLGPATGVHVVRRCADLAELLAAASAGLGSAAVISADLPQLDGEALARLRSARVAVVVLAEPGDPLAPQRLRLLGVTAPLPADSAPAIVARAVLAAAHPPDARQIPGPAVGTGPAAGPAPEPPSPSPPLPSPAFPSQAFPSPPSPGRPSPGRTADVSAATGTTLGLDPTAPAGADPPAPAQRGQLVAVWGPTGAPGRTTVAVNLATELALAGQSTVIADADTYGPSVAQTLALLDESAGLAAAVRAANQGVLDVERLARLAPAVQSGLRVLTGIPRPGRWPELRPSGLEVVWRVARDLAAWTVVDCGFGLESDEEVSFDVAVPRRNGATLCTLNEADLVLVVGFADPIGLNRLVRGLQDLRELLPPSRPRRVVVTRVRESSVGAPPQRRVAEALARYAGVTDGVLLVDDRAACDAAMLAGRSLAEVAPQSPVRRRIADLATELVAAGPPEPAGRWAGAGRVAGRPSRRLRVRPNRGTTPTPDRSV